MELFTGLILVADKIEDHFSEKEKEHMKQMKAIILEPEKTARVEMIDGSLEGLQSLVGGYIEAIFPFDYEKYPLNQAAIICNDSGKIERLPLNRAIRDMNGDLVDIIAGTAVIVGLDADDFTSLNDEQINHYFPMFELAEGFFRYGPRILSFPLLPLLEP